MLEPNFWKDKSNAQKIIKEKKFHEDLINSYNHSVVSLKDLSELNELATDEKISSEKNLLEVDMTKLPTQKVKDVWNGTLINSLREMHLKGEWFKNEVCKECVMSTSNVDDAV